MVHPFPLRADRDDVQARYQAKIRKAGAPMPNLWCWSCGRPVDPKHDIAAIYEASSYVALLPNEVAKTVMDAEYCEIAAITIGPECAKKLPKGYVLSVADASRIVVEATKAFEAWRSIWPYATRYGVGAHDDYPHKTREAAHDYPHKTREAAQIVADRYNEKENKPSPVAPDAGTRRWVVYEKQVRVPPSEAA